MHANALQEQNKELVEKMRHDPEVRELADKWFNLMLRYKYHYRFSWLGIPIIQFPQDMIAMQEIVWKVKPDLIIETGIAHGGSLVFYASMLELIGGDGQVVGVDIDIREHNRVNIEKHPMCKRITMIEGSSVDENTVQKVYKLAKGRDRVMVVLDSNHTYEHVCDELRFYSPLVAKDSYLIVCDTVIEDIPDEFCKDRPWSKGNNSKTAVLEFLKDNDEFINDESIDEKLFLTVCPNGFLKRVK